MKFKKIIPYKMKHVLPILGLAGASVVSSCEKVAPTEPKPVKTEVDILFDANNVHVLGRMQGDDFVVSDIIQYYVENPDIKAVYLYTQGDWSNWRESAISINRELVFQKVINYSSKMRGRGDFNFMLGEASKVPEDSLWYVQNGWTINKQYQR